MEDPIVYPSPFQLLKPTPSPPDSKTDDVEDDDKPDPTPVKKKKTSPRRKSVNKATIKVGNDGVAKPKQTKSRTGCQACKDKRLKCDEKKPTCDNCKRRNVPCPGYKTNFQFRDLTVSLHQHGGSKLGAQPKKQKPLQQDAPQGQTSPTSDGQAQVLPTAPTSDHSASPRDAQDSASGKPASTFSTPTNGTQGSSRHQSASLSPPRSHSVTQTLLSPVVASGLASPPGSASEGLLPDDALQSLPEDVTVPAMVDLSNNPGSPSMWNSMPGPDEMLDTSMDPNDFDEEITRNTDFSMQIPSDPFDLDNSIGNSSLALSPRSAVALAHNIQMAFLPQEPSFATDSVETITLHFDRLTCGILSVKDGPTENPWRTLLWPMAQDSLALFHSVCALAAFHGARHEPRLRNVGREHNDRAIANLHEGLRDESIDREARLAASLALGFADGWNHHTTSGNMHIKGARMMIRQALEEHKNSPLRGLRLARLKFLCNAWVYMDVIARLTSTDQDETDDYEQIYTAFGNPHIQQQGFGIDFGMGVDAQLDPLMGCASTLFPLIGRTANLARRVRRSNSNSPAIITQALELKEQLEAWDPPDFIEEPEDPTSTVPHALQTARAYQWATLLYLHQTVPEIPSATSSQMAKKVLQLLATVPAQSRFLIVHIFPLMAAGCEAVTEEDRQWVRDRWQAMGRRLQIGSIDKCMEITEEVWARRDLHSAAPRRLVPTTNPHEINLPRHNRPGRNDSMDPRTGGLGLSAFQPNMDVDMNEGLFPMMMSRPSWPQVREWSDEMNSQYNVSGRLHWLGVMNDHGWEDYDPSSSSALKHMTHLPKQTQTYQPPLIANSNAFLGDVVSSSSLLKLLSQSTSTGSSPSTPTRGPLSAGFFHLAKGEALEYEYSYDEMKLVLEGEFTVTDLLAEKTVRAGEGDVFFFPKGSELRFESTGGDTGKGEVAKAFFVGGREEGVL
ncbi:Fungal specific transcription factor domain-containing protein 26 [Elsinoe fawcettii]|nr:Fungal specific transcription factor domain-containing protein 26 [Elsinoe fawcettii]